MIKRLDHRSVSRTGSAGNTNTTNQFRRSKTSDEEDGERRSRSLDYTGPYTCEGSTALSKVMSAKVTVILPDLSIWF